MRAEMSSAVNSSTAESEALKIAVAELFVVFRRKYGHRWREQFEDQHSRPTWFASFRAAGLTADMVRAGLARLSKVGTGWPPSDEEFIRVCRPEVPAISLDAAIGEAVRWARDPSHQFSHPAIGAAAKHVGAQVISTFTQREVRMQFAPALQQALERMARGEDLDVPMPKALPAKVRRRTEPGQPTPQSVLAEWQKLASITGVQL